MSRLVDVGATDELAAGAMKEVSVEGRELVVARVGDRFYAADGRCPHMRGHLARGSLQGTVVVCPFHGSRFDLVDGRVLQWTRASGVALRLVKSLRAPRSLVTHPIQAKDGRLLVELP
jgi:nitrite reductase/ring-hydroxylating ferredoxin subunit